MEVYNDGKYNILILSSKNERKSHQVLISYKDLYKFPAFVST